MTYEREMRYNARDEESEEKLYGLRSG